MTTWILAVVLLGLGAVLGYKQGAIRVAFTFVGIIAAALLASLIAKLIAPLVKLATPNIVYQEVGALLAGFLMVLVIFKVIGQAVHQVVEKQQRRGGEVRYGLWERLNMRLGLCLGLVNGLLYLVLVSSAIYMGSYWTVQMSTPAAEPPMAAKVINTLGKDLEASGMTKVAEAVNRMPESYYQAADVVGLVYNNPILETRLSHYPAFLSLAQRSEFKELANDPTFTQLLQNHAPIGEVLAHKKAKEMLSNPNLLKEIQAAIEPNLEDIKSFLETGKSVRYNSEPIVGRWVFDSRTTMAVLRRDKPNLPSVEFGKLRLWVTTRFAKATVVASPDQQFFLQDFPKWNMTEVETIPGHWRSAGGSYSAQLDNSGEEKELTLSGGHLSLIYENMTLTFAQEQ